MRLVFDRRLLLTDAPEMREIYFGEAPLCFTALQSKRIKGGGKEKKKGKEKR